MLVFGEQFKSLRLYFTELKKKKTVVTNSFRYISIPRKMFPFFRCFISLLKIEKLQE